MGQVGLDRVGTEGQAGCVARQRGQGKAAGRGLDQLCLAEVFFGVFKELPGLAEMLGWTNLDIVKRFGADSSLGRLR